MRDERVCLAIAFAFALLPALICPALMPRVRLSFFAPFLILLLYRRPLGHCLWMALASGLILDLLSSHQRLGIQALSYLLTTWLLFRQKRHIFVDKITTLPLMTALFAVISTAIQMTLLQIFDPTIGPSWGWMATDLLVWPAVDALYALTWFQIPASLLKRCPRRGW